MATTEFELVAELAPEFAKRHTKVMGVSVDDFICFADYRCASRNRGAR